MLLIKIYGFAFGVNTTDIIYPKNIAAAIPPAVAVVPPRKMPKNHHFVLTLLLL